jgi:hypothetical protein
MGSLSVASYYGGGILARLHTEAEITLRPTVSQSVRLGVEPTVGLTTRYKFCLNFAVLSLWGALSDERSGLSLVSHCQQ